MYSPTVGTYVNILKFAQQLVINGLTESVVTIKLGIQRLVKPINRQQLGKLFPISAFSHTCSLWRNFYPTSFRVQD